MARVIDRFPSIRKAHLEMVYDNGGIFNGVGLMPSRGEEDALNETEEVLGAEGVYEEDLRRLDEWLSTLTDEQIQILVAGEEGESRELASTGPHGGPDNKPLSDIFNDLFEVC